jgi:regulator of replication initiation timing
MGIKNIANQADVEYIANLLLAQDRKQPICLVSIPSDPGESAFDIDALTEVCDGLAFLVTIPNGEHTYALAKLLPESTHVYGGAARVYPIGFNRETSYADVPLLFPSRGKSKASQQKVENEIWRLADTGKLLKEREKRAEQVTARVVRVFPPSLAVVSFGSHPMVPLRQELCFPGVPIDWVVIEGDELKGTYDPTSHDFIPSGSNKRLDEVVGHYGLGKLVLGLVRSVERQKGLITVFPGIDLPISREEISHNELDIVSDFLDPGDVVAARLYRDPQGKIRLRMDDIDDDEVALEALPVIEGGRPWLIEGRNEEEEKPDEEPVAPAVVVVPEFTEIEPLTDTGSIPVPKPGMMPGIGQSTELLSGRDRSAFEHQVKILNGRVQQLLSEIKLLQQADGEMRIELGQYRSENESLRGQLTEQRKKSTAAKRQSVRGEQNRSTTKSRRERWTTNEEWFGEELRRAWIGRYKPEDRNIFKLDLSKVSYGENFFESLKQPEVAEEDLRKCVRVVVDTVTGRNSKGELHEVHSLRTSASPSAPNLTRDDGSVCMRIYLEENRAQAKRLHFWKTANSWELSRVVLHDDYRP